jgi:uncharacterized protein YecE (DUF72 family)
MTEYYFGTMGFSYEDWKGVFYGAGSPAREYLTHYARIFSSVEIDTTFYAIPRIEVVQGWAAAVPNDFRFVVKTPQSITHEMGLANSKQYMTEFISVIRCLGVKLGVILIQLPPSYASDQFPALAAFIEDLPDDSRFAVEFRHRSWFTPQMGEFLSTHRIGWVATEFGNLPHQIHPTTDFLYIRWLGKHAAFRRYDREQVDRDERLVWWKEQINANLAGVQTVYGYFNNDYSGFAPATCNRFKTMLNLPTIDFHQPVQGRLF